MAEISVYVDTGIEDLARPVREEDIENTSMSLYVTKAMIYRCGHSGGCRGCNALKYNTKQEVHSPECRSRIIERLKESLEGRRKTVLMLRLKRREKLVCIHSEQLCLHVPTCSTVNFRSPEKK